MTKTPRAPAKTFQDLIVWQKAHQFVLAVYRFTDGFPKSEIYGLSQQLRPTPTRGGLDCSEYCRGLQKEGQSG
jgi:hypothetical protein